MSDEAQPKKTKRNRGNDRLTITFGRGTRRKLHAMARAQGLADSKLVEQLVSEALDARLASRLPATWPGESSDEEPQQVAPKRRGFLGANGYELALASVDDRIYAAIDRESRGADDEAGSRGCPGRAAHLRPPR